MKKDSFIGMVGDVCYLSEGEYISVFLDEADSCESMLTFRAPIVKIYFFDGDGLCIECFGEDFDKSTFYTNFRFPDIDTYEILEDKIVKNRINLII